MHVLTVLYRAPGNPEGFESHYEQSHLPLVRDYPGLRAIRSRRYDRVPTGGQPAFFLQLDLLFDDVDALDRALRAEDAREVASDLVAMAEKYDVEAELMIGEEQEIA